MPAYLLDSSVRENLCSPRSMFPQTLFCFGNIIFLGSQKAQQESFKSTFFLQSLFSPSVV